MDRLPLTSGVNQPAGFENAEHRSRSTVGQHEGPCGLRRVMRQLSAADTGMPDRANDVAEALAGRLALALTERRLSFMDGRAPRTADRDASRTDSPAAAPPVPGSLEEEDRS